MADIFISYTGTDREWAFWIGHELIALGRTPHIHDWELPAGGDIMKWMDERYRAADHILCVVSTTYLEQPYSSLERRAAQWATLDHRPNFAIPVFVEPCTAPALFATLKRCDLYGLAEEDSRARLKAFLEPPKPQRAGFPGGAKASSPPPASNPPSSFPGGLQGEAEARSSVEYDINVDAAIIHGAPGDWFKPGAGRVEWFKDHEYGPDMVVAPAGKFMMGSADGEGDDDELRQHKVRIAHPFAVGRFAVLFDEWDAAHRDGGVKHNPDGRGWGRGRRPVTNVSWEDAQAYVGWLSRKTGKSYRLLSEAEWEYCCRAGTATAYSFGDAIDKRQAQFSAGETAEAGSFPANAWGLYDMHGNVWEWCKDNWHPDYHGAPANGSVWKGGDASTRVVRGGSWNSNPHYLRSADRDRYRPDYRDNWVGFRVARML